MYLLARESISSIMVSASLIYSFNQTVNYTECPTFHNILPSFLFASSMKIQEYFRQQISLPTLFSINQVMSKVYLASNS